MVRNRPRRLVIDSDVTGAAGEKAGISLACAQFLLAVRDTGHRTVMTDPLLDEWKRHRSGFSHQWLRTMYAARKVDRVSIGVDDGLRAALVGSATEKDAEIMLKDTHLIEAALATEMRIISREVACRGCFRSAAARVNAIRSICWVDPTMPAEHSIDWLHRGAPLERHRLLGSPVFGAK